MQFSPIRKPTDGLLLKKEGGENSLLFSTRIYIATIATRERERERVFSLLVPSSLLALPSLPHPPPLSPPLPPPPTRKRGLTLLCSQFLLPSRGERKKAKQKRVGGSTPVFRLPDIPTFFGQGVPPLVSLTERELHFAKS